jgi:Putative lumazine-binding
VSHGRTIIATLLVSTLFVVVAYAQPDYEQQAVRAAILEYIEGWYEGDSVKVQKNVHSELTKRRLVVEQGVEKSELRQESALTFLRRVQRGGGKGTPLSAQKKDITVLDVHGSMATAKLEAWGWVEYMHLVKENGQWHIVNDLWELKEPVR